MNNTMWDLVLKFFFFLNSVLAGPVNNAWDPHIKQQTQTQPLFSAIQMEAQYEKEIIHYCSQDPHIKRQTQTQPLFSAIQKEAQYEKEIIHSHIQ